MLDDDISDQTTRINWDCHDGTDRSRLLFRGIAEKPLPLPAENRAARQRRKLREQLVREHILNADPAPSVAGWIIDRLFGCVRYGGN
jgi:hypothetical protein